MNPVKLGAFLILGVIAFAIAVKIIFGLVAGILTLLLPLAIVGGIGLILYGMISGGRPLGRGNRYLP